MIRSAPLNEPTTLISNPYMIAFDGKRDEVLVPNCVAQPWIAAYSTSADKNAVPSRIIEGQNTKLNRTVHAIAYDDIHDEIVVQSNIGQAVLTFRGGANGDEAPIRVIQGPKTLLRDPQSLFVDPVNNEIYVLNMGTDDTLLVYDRLAQGDVAPKRVLKSPAAIGGVGAADPVSNLIFLAGARRRSATSTTAPRRARRSRVRTIGGGPISGLRRPGRIVVHSTHPQPRRHERAGPGVARSGDDEPGAGSVDRRVEPGRRGRRAAALHAGERPPLHAARADAGPEEEDRDRQRQVHERGADVLAAGAVRAPRRARNGPRGQLDPVGGR